MRVRAVVAYDGTSYHGFAAQRDGVRTVAGELNVALSLITRNEVEIECAGRTDAGVHARGQVIAFNADDATDLERLTRAVNGRLGPTIAMREVEAVDESFDPRRDARSRSYRYTIVNRVDPDPMLARYAWHVPVPLDLEAMREAIPHFLGEHDFASFCRRGPEGTTTIRRVLSLTCIHAGDGVTHIDITGTAFCWQMVRSIVGTLVEIGHHKKRPDAVPEIFQARDRAAAGTVAPPHGLCLERVEY